MYHNPAAPWDLGSVKAISFDVWAPVDLDGQASVVFRINRGKKTSSAPAVVLKKGWNEIAVDLSGDWLASETRAGATKLSWLLATGQSGLSGEVVFDNLRAE